MALVREGQLKHDCIIASYIRLIAVHIAEYAKATLLDTVISFNRLSRGCLTAQAVALPSGLLSSVVAADNVAMAAYLTALMLTPVPREQPLGHHLQPQQQQQQLKQEQQQEQHHEGQ